MALLNGKVVIVTGGGRGIGREHCLELARRGASVVVVDPGVGVRGETSDEDPADEVVREIEAAGGKAVAEKTSVSDWNACKGLVERTVGLFGRLDGVVNNAGILRDRMITSMTEEDFDAVIAVHLKGTFAMTKHACDHWRAVAKGGGDISGRIVNTTSGSGLWGNVGQANYASAKAGIVGLTIVTAMEMTRYNVTCNVVSPVAVTRMTANVGHINSSSDGEYDPRHPKATSPLVAYLLTDAAGWLTGQVLRVDGNTVIKLDGWAQSNQRYTTKTPGYLDAEELIDGMRFVYGTLPAGIPTS